MKKYFNEKHDAIIKTQLHCIEKNKKYGEMADHSQKVENVTYEYFNYNEKPKRVVLNRDLILDLADQIRDIESKIITTNKDDLPF